MRDNPHDYTIEKICEQFGYSRAGLPATWRAFVEARGFPPVADETDLIAPRGFFRRVPDAFYFDFEDEVLTCVEVESTCPINVDRINDYVNLWFYLDCMEIELELYVVPRYTTEVLYLTGNDIDPATDLHGVNLMHRYMTTTFDRAVKRKYPDLPAAAAAEIVRNSGDYLCALYTQVGIDVEHGLRVLRPAKTAGEV